MGLQQFVGIVLIAMGLGTMLWNFNASQPLPFIGIGLAMVVVGWWFSHAASKAIAEGRRKHQVYEDEQIRIRARRDEQQRKP